ncbi:hypothetical protein ACX0HA_00595 [Flavobacterium hauense]
MNNIIFTETQRFEFWHVLILAAVTALIFYCIKRFKPKQGSPLNSTIGKVVLYICAAIPVPVLILFLVMSLNTKIDSSGINVKFSPFDREWKTYKWETIRNCDVRTYNAMHDYGGWGMRNGAYNVSGDKGLFIRFTNGKHFLIGTQKPEEMEKVVQQLNKR